MPRRRAVLTITSAITFLIFSQLSQAQTAATTFDSETGNNTAACSGPNDPLGNHPYCSGNLIGFPTEPSNTNAQTQMVDEIPGHMSYLPLSAWLYPGATTKFIVNAKESKRNMGSLSEFGPLLILVAALVVNLSAAQAQTFSTVHNFAGSPDDGWEPGGLTGGPAGVMFGPTQVGGSVGFGTVFEFSPSQGDIILHSFTGPDGQSPFSVLLRSGNGNLYGTTSSGGAYFYGNVFRLRGGQFTDLHDFQGPPDGAIPYDGVIENIDGALYGTTGIGGTGSCLGGCGTIYKIDKFDRETVLYSFHGPDGAYPGAALIHDERGNLYGTTTNGGANQSCQAGCGTVFMLQRSGQFKVLHSFKGGTEDGWWPATGVVRDAEGNLFGTTSAGGTSNNGTLYEITRNGEEKVLYNFAGPPDGSEPGALLLTSSGRFYGTTFSGGETGCWGLYGGCGIIFWADKFGNERVIHTFNGLTDGAQPTGAPIMDSEGNLYGTTLSGVKDGCTFTHAGCGTIWRLVLPSLN